MTLTEWKIQTFWKVYNHLKTQNKASVHEYGDCQYLGSDGSKCAIGCLIPCEFYDSSMEGLNATALIETYDDLRKLLVPEELLIHDCKEFFADLQHAHDDASERSLFWDHCNKNLKLVSQKHMLGLTF